MRSKKPSSATKANLVIFITLLLASAIVPPQAQAQKFKVLHTFHGAPGDGYGPLGVLVRDGAGNLYGTTGSGGGGRGLCTNYGGCGTAFKLDKTGKKVSMHSFTFPKGWYPEAGLLRDKTGDLYGTTAMGGDTSCYSSGCGTVFKLDKTGKEIVLHKFTGTPDGMFPGQPLLVEDRSGNLYGTTSVGGAYGAGTIFRVDKAGKETGLYSFTGYADGCFPDAGVILDATGNLYGVALQGGIAFCNSGYGTVFELDTTGKFTVLHTFDVGDGAYPGSALLLDGAGNLYGTTVAGGDSFVCGSTGCGTVFKLRPQSGGGWTETVLYSFCSLGGCTDGQEPGTGPLAVDEAGNLYGTTYFGGTSRCGGSGCGVVFKLDTSGKEAVIHDFSGGSDGAYPTAGVILDRTGNLYGTATSGGDPKCHQGCGTLFRITH
jgi:uncharacterized repeat protein (TIGR03803 family)